MQTYVDGSPMGGDAKLSTFSITDRGSAVSFSYDAASGTYMVQDSGGSAKFGAPDRKADASYANVYASTAGTVSNELTLFGNARSDTASSAPVALSYTSYGLWVHADSAANLTNRTYFLYGQPTGAANMPTTGTATYNMTASAQIFRTNYVPSTLTAVGGSATLTANFGNGTVSTALTLASPSFNGTFNGTGSIGADQFSGTFPTTGSFTTSSGNFSGGFFGPGAKEAGYVFQINIHNPDPYAGAAPAPMDTYISGVAIGKSGGTAQAAPKAMAAPQPIDPVGTRGRKF
jgi:hypothetical protein